MRIYTIIFCLLLSMDALAQNNSDKKDTANNRYHDAISSITTKNPLYILDGKQIDDTLSNQIVQKLDPNKIKSIDVLKGAAAQALYGAKGANGVIIIKTKDDKGNKKLDFSSVAEKDTTYVVDGQLSANKYNGVNPNDIICITILKNSDVGDKHISNPDKVVVIVITKPFAISQYQQKFSNLSKD